MGTADSGLALDPIGVASSTDYNGKERVGEGLISHGRHAYLGLDKRRQGLMVPVAATEGNWPKRSSVPNLQSSLSNMTDKKRMRKRKEGVTEKSRGQHHNSARQLQLQPLAYLPF